MAEEADDQWLYGSNPPAPDVTMTEPASNAESEIETLKNGKAMNTSSDGDGALKIHEENETDKDLIKEGEEGEVLLDDIDDDSDDDVNVVIGEIAAPTSLYSGFKLGKGGSFSTPQAAEKKSQGNFAVNEFDGVGTINGVPAHEFNLDSLEDKPWRKPGADITDYFNYGFNEDTWRAYCERQKRMRLNESGTSISHLPLKPFQTSVERHVPKVAPPSAPRRYTASLQPTKTTIDVIGSSAPSRRATGFPGDTSEPPPSTAYPLPPPSLASYGAPPPAVFSGYQQPPPTVAPPPAAPAFYDPYTPAPPPAQQPSPWSNPPPPQAWPIGTPTSLPPPSVAPSESAYSPGRPTHDWSPERDRGDRDRRPLDVWSPERDLDRDRSGSRHHRRRSRSRSRERSRRHRSRSRSPSHRHSSRRKSKKKDRDSD